MLGFRVRVWVHEKCYLDKGIQDPILESQMEKTRENAMETGVIWCLEGRDSHASETAIPYTFRGTKLYVQNLI